LIENNFQGLEGQTLPDMSDEYIEGVAERYIELYEAITAEKFIKADTENISERIEKNVNSYLNNL
jgi:phosphoribosylaminoimidazole-succinocarboxamide synthase